MNGKINSTKFILLFLCFISQSLYSQKYSIEGVVTNNEGAVLEGIGIQVFKNDTLKDYTFSDTKGKYSFNLKKGIYKLQISSLQYESQTRQLVLNRSIKDIFFILNERITSLEEITLKVSRDIEIREDTIIFKASAFKNKRQIVLEDLLKDIPGIEVSENGNLTFQGKLVTNVKVENDDLFNGGYQILTKNLKSDLVDKVQLLQNYSSNPLLKNVRDTEDVAINITLKEDRKSTFFGDLELQSNLNNRHQLNSNLISFLDKSKYYVISDFNTVGKNTFNSIKDIFTTKSDNSNLRLGKNQGAKVFTTLNTTRPNLKDEYVNLNETQLYNLNSIFNINSKLKIKTNLIGFINNTSFIQNQNTTFLSEPVINFTESSDINQEEKAIFGIVNLTWNLGEKNYLEYTGNLSRINLDAISNIFIQENSLDETTQSIGKKQNHFINFTHKINNNSVLQFTSRYLKDNIPQSYEAFPLVFTNTSNNNYDLLRSNLRNNVNYFTTQLSVIKNTDYNNYEFYIGYHNKKENLNSNILFRNIDSNQFESPSNEFINNLQLHQNLYFIKNRIRRRFNQLDLFANVDLYLEENDMSNFNNKNFFYYSGNLNLKYKEKNKHEFLFSTGVNQFTNPIRNLNSGFIPRNYRLFEKGLNENTLLKNYSAGLNYNYGNWNDIFTAGLSANYIYGDKYLSFNANFQDIINELNKIVLSGRNEYRLNIFFDKYFKFISSNFKVNYSFNNLTYANQVENTLRNITISTNSYSVELRSNFNSFFDYHFGYNVVNRNTLIEKNSVSVTNRRAFFDLDFYAKGFLLNIENDIFYFDPKSNISNYHFFNLKGSYEVNKKLTVNLKAHNILNNNTFDVFSQTDFAQFSSRVPLIERYILLGVNLRF